MASEGEVRVPDLVDLGSPQPGGWIAGQPMGGDPHDLPNPSTGNRLAQCGWVDAGIVDDAVEAARQARNLWGRLDGRRRATALRQIASSIRANAAQLGWIVAAETGKRLAEGEAEAEFSARYFDWYAEAATFATEGYYEQPSRRYFVRRHPVGVVAAVTPWNFPLSIPARKLAPALAAGCPVVLKPSELTPLSALVLTRLCEEHLPHGAVGMVVGDGEKLTTRLVDHPAIAAVSFTGSNRVGTLVAARAMETLTRVTMELGGRAPFIVCEDADLEVALEAAQVAKFRNNGASCIAANNFFVHERHYGEFVRRFTQRMQSLRLGDALDRETELGPLLRPSHVEALETSVAAAETSGCPVTRVAAPESAGFFCGPAVVEAEQDTDLWHREVFGPVAVMKRFSDEDDVAEEVNAWRTGLGGYVMSADPQHGLDLAARLQTGIVGINNGAPNTPEVPFGGFGMAGIGREGGLAGMYAFLEEQTLSLAR